MPMYGGPFTRGEASFDREDALILIMMKFLGRHTGSLRDTTTLASTYWLRPFRLHGCYKLQSPSRPLKIMSSGAHQDFLKRDSCGELASNSIEVSFQRESATLRSKLTRIPVPWIVDCMASEASHVRS